MHEWIGPGMRTPCAVVALALALLGTRSAQAENSASAFRAESVGDSICPETMDFSKQLLRRTKGLRQALPQEAAVTFRIGVNSESGAVVGRLMVVESDGNETERVVSGVGCDEVVSALALIAAVLVAPSGSGTRLPVRPAAAPAVASEPVKRDAKARWRFAGGIAQTLDGGVAPQVSPGVALELAAELNRSSTLSPLFAVSVTRSLPIRATTAAGVGRFEWQAIRFSSCAFRWQTAAPIVTRLCAFFDVGEIRAAGENTERSDSVTAPWLAAGGTLRVELHPLPSLGVTLEPGVLMPIRRGRFYFEPQTPENVAFDVPAVALSARLGIVIWLP